jgi:hypothetical protein
MSERIARLEGQITGLFNSQAIIKAGVVGGAALVLAAVLGGAAMILGQVARVEDRLASLEGKVDALPEQINAQLLGLASTFANTVAAARSGEPRQAPIIINVPPASPPAPQTPHATTPPSPN